MAKKSRSSKRRSVSSVLSGIWSVIVRFARLLYRALCQVLSVLYEFFKLLFQLLKTLFLGLSALIAACSLGLVAIALLLWVTSSLLGLPNSTVFQEKRDLLIEEFFDSWEAQRLLERQHHQAKRAGVKIYEVTDVSCVEDTDCETPIDYLIRSSCPFGSKCLEGQCAVVCSEPSSSR